MANYSIFSESQFVGANKAVRRIAKTNKFTLKVCIKIIGGMQTKDEGKVGNLSLCDALESCGFKAFSTSLLTFMDAERTKMIGIYAPKGSKQASKLGDLVEAAYALTDESDLGMAVTAAHEHLAAEKAKEAEREAKIAAAREKEVAELKAYFIGLGMTEEEAESQSAMCRIIRASVKEGKSLWSINDLFASFAYTKADTLAIWEDAKEAVDEARKAEREAKKAERAERKKEREAKKAAKADENKRAYELAIEGLKKAGHTPTADELMALAQTFGQEVAA